MKKKKSRALVSELRAGYSNTQELIRFMDAKAGVAMGFSGVVFTHCMDKFFSTFPCIPESPLCSLYVLKLILLFAFILTTVFVFLSALNCIIARGAIKQSALPRILFPVGNHKDFALFRNDIENQHKNHEIEELMAQLFNVGIIFEIKMAKCKQAINMLIAQILIWAAIMIVFWVSKTIC